MTLYQALNTLLPNYSYVNSNQLFQDTINLDKAFDGELLEQIFSIKKLNNKDLEDLNEYKDWIYVQTSANGPEGGYLINPAYKNLCNKSIVRIDRTWNTSWKINIEDRVVATFLINPNDYNDLYIVVDVPCC